MDLELAIRGDLRETMAQRLRVAERAVTSAVRSTTFGLQRQLRREAKRAFRNAPAALSGGSIEKTVAARVTPAKGASLDVEGLVFSRALYRRPSGQVDLLEVFERGTEIRAGGGNWLAIPTEHAPLRSGRGGPRRARPKESGLRLQFLPTRDPRVGCLVLRERSRAAGAREGVVYWLVREVRLAKRLDIAAGERKWSARLGPQIERNLDRFASQAGVQV